ncbi:MAG: lysine--tRNA ligase, partial [Magnetococcales bacterium]|nr:lysine--tRNA ligase [Magnetococcales bacterium]
MWIDTVVNNLEGHQILNDSKTPSGRIHVGSLRGVLIHDAVLRELRRKGLSATFLYGIDDYDPMDEVPTDPSSPILQHVGRPLCDIPPPPGSHATDLADHYIQEFLDIFKELNVDASVYRMRDLYRSGQFNEAIDIILRHAALVREIYLKVSNSKRAEDWHPFQVVCPNCGKIGTTVVSAYDGREVTFHCKPDLVQWAKGCDARGQISPFDGRGKLPWKLEWAAKWHSLGITIEGAGKDHCTKGGSRDIASAVLREIFKKSPPKNIPYEFFLVGGAKMSSSKGIGSAARDMADFLPPEILRFLMIGSDPKKTVNFDASLQYMVKLFNEYDQHLAHRSSGNESEITRNILSLAQCSPTSDSYQPINFQLITTLIQLPHLNLYKVVEEQAGVPLNEVNKAHLEQRIKAAKYWLANLAAPEDRFTVQESLPVVAQGLAARHRAFLHQFADALKDGPDSGDDIQSLIFATARLTPISQPDAFKAIYNALIGKERGPKAGSLISFLDRQFVMRRFKEMTFSQDAFLSEVSISMEAFYAWLDGQAGSVESIQISCESISGKG